LPFASVQHLAVGTTSRAHTVQFRVEQFTTFKPGPHQEGAVHAMLDNLVAWGQAPLDMRARRTQSEEGDENV